MLATCSSYLLGQRTEATISTMLETTDCLHRRQRWSKTPTPIFAHGDTCSVTFTDGSFQSRMDGTSEMGHVVCMVDPVFIDLYESLPTPISWYPHTAPRMARASPSIETQSASNGEEQLQYVRLVFAKFSLASVSEDWSTIAQSIPAAMVKDEPACLGMKERRTEIEALALKRSLLPTATRT